jgi:hypothetical protein
MCGDRFPSPAPLVSRFPAAHVHDCNQLGLYGAGELKPPLVSIRLPVFGRCLLLRGSNGSISAPKATIRDGRSRLLSAIQGTSEQDNAIQFGQILCWVVVCALESRTKKSSTVNVVLSFTETSWERKIQVGKPVSHRGI